MNMKNANRFLKHLFYEHHCIMLWNKKINEYIIVFFVFILWRKLRSVLKSIVILLFEFNIQNWDEAWNEEDIF